MSIARMWEAGGQAAREEQERSALAKHLQPALGGNQPALSALYGASPEMGMKVEGLAQQRAQGADKARAERLARSGKLAAAFAQNPHPLIWRQFKAEVSDIPELAQMPEDLSDPNDAKGAAELARAWAAAHGTPSDDGVPSSIRELQMLQANPELRKLDMERRQAGWRPTPLATDQGYAVFDPRTGGAAPLNYGQPQQSNMQYQTEDGQPVPPEDMAAFTAAMTQGGTFAVGPGGQSVPVARPAMGAFGGPERVRPPSKAAGATFAPLTQDEIQQMGMPAGTVAQRNLQTGEVKVVSRPPAPPKGLAQAEVKRAREVKQQEASFAEIERLTNKLDRMNNVSGWSATLMPFGEDRNTYQSTAGQLAVLLKPLIRGPGEGTWTDKDQELLERLVPKLENYEGTNQEVIENIRSLIKSRRSGLGIGEPQAPAAPANGGFRILPD